MVTHFCGLNKITDVLLVPVPLNLTKRFFFDVDPYDGDNSQSLFHKFGDSHALHPVCLEPQSQVKI